MARISESSPNYKKRFLILPHEVIEPLYSWHGGQFSSVYSLASTGDHDLVSPAMIEAAISELERDLRKQTGKLKRELSNLIGDLDMVLSSPREFSAKEAGMDIAEDEYEYSPNAALAENQASIVPWLIGAAVVGGIVYFVTRPKKAAASTVSQQTTFCFSNELGVRECYSAPLSEKDVARLKQIYPNASPELKTAIDRAFKSSGVVQGHPSLGFTV